MIELVFDVIQEADGGFCAECLSETIATEGDSRARLKGIQPKSRFGVSPTATLGTRPLASNVDIML